MTVLYLISKLVTFPAVMVRAFYEHILLKLLRIPVEKASYLQFNEMFGHTEHDLTKTLSASVWFCCIPGLLQVLLAVPMMAASFLQLYVLSVTPTDPQTGSVSIMFAVCIILRVFGIWLLCNVFPLYEDALNLWEKATQANGFAKVVALPIAAIVRAGAFLERFGITLLLLVAETCLLFFL
ncbi:MAG: hypothetical protein IJB86_08415 [Clostridia bacterium]|nr:hypothetical protein [Clostridia bacterium]MBQ7054916.1 hypothetical protein [Oscillospiraceae bacterium]